jgi:hypothetical protein
LTPPIGGGRVRAMGSILIRKVPGPVHQDFKKLCQRREISMEKLIIRLIEKEVSKESKRNK